MIKVASKTLRCAIYTRVSTEYGLEQEFNSLDAQREASEAFVKSQAHEGWRLLPAHYDDGGFSGGSMERPALKKLLDDIRGRRIDVVVVYKVDRLTRSLGDFGKLVELFDAHQVSFVSVTQAFNTTNSMGRLTLNVLLSFAQFEREVTGERIRDKIAASKRKGMRMGGPVPLGYVVENKKLVVNPEEADRVRLIFRRYLELGSLSETLRELRACEIVTKRTYRKDGSVRGGIPFAKGALSWLLRNRVYVGDVVHKGKHFPGEHAGIIDPGLHEAVQGLLTSQTQARQQARLTSAFLLSGRIFDDRGNRMSPSTARKGAARYRYYVSGVLTEGRKEHAGSIARAGAAEVEAAVVAALVERDADSLSGEAAAPPVMDRETIARRVDKVVLRPTTIEITLAASDDASADIITVSWSHNPGIRKRDIILPAGQDANMAPIRSETRARLVEAIAKGRQWLDELVSSHSTSTAAIAEREGCSDRSVRMNLSLAFLSPTIIKAAVDGRLPEGLGVVRLIDQPADWDRQMEMISE